MKKALPVLVIAISVIIGLCLGGTIQKNKEEALLQNACMLYVETALSDFISYQETNNVDDYWQGTSAFYAYINTYSLIENEIDSHFLYCNELYSHLISNQTAIQVHLDEFISILELLNKDIGDNNAAQRIFAICNEISME